MTCWFEMSYYALRTQQEYHIFPIFFTTFLANKLGFLLVTEAQSQLEAVRLLLGLFLFKEVFALLNVPVSPHLFHCDIPKHAFVERARLVVFDKLSHTITTKGVSTDQNQRFSFLLVIILVAYFAHENMLKMFDVLILLL